MGRHKTRKLTKREQRAEKAAEYKQAVMADEPMVYVDGKRMKVIYKKGKGQGC